jgi:hypothetical protein
MQLLICYIGLADVANQEKAMPARTYENATLWAFFISSSLA